MEKRYYVDFGKKVTEQLRKEINGLVKFEIYPNINTIIFRITFKDFDYNHAISRISELYMDGNSEQVVDEIIHKYRSAVLNAFFKSDERKARDRMKELGIELEDYDYVG